MFEKWCSKVKSNTMETGHGMDVGCVTIEDHNENIRISKGKSHANGKRIDGIIAAIMALGGSLRQKGTIEVSAEMNEDDFIFNSSK
jgi:phage terminase large subunit-like protein